MERLFARVALAVSALSTLLTGAVAADYPPQPAVIASNPFLGGYVAGGGSYGTASPRSFNETSSFLGTTGLDAGFFGNASPTGWSGIAAAGYNMTFGPALVGIELDGRWGDEGFSKQSAAINLNGIGPAGTIAYNYSFKNDAGVQLSGRLGAVFGETLIFGKIGVGASRIADSFGVNQTGATRCGSLSFSSTTPVCVGPANGGAGSLTQTRWAPSLILGVGAERNVGAFFMRGGVEAETFAQDTLSIAQQTAPGWSFSANASSPNTQWTVRGSVLAGLRF